MASRVDEDGTTPGRREPSEQLGVRLPLRLVRRLEQYVAGLQDRANGDPVSFRKAIECLLVRALDDAETREGLVRQEITR